MDGIVALQINPPQQQQQQQRGLLHTHTRTRHSLMNTPGKDTVKKGVDHRTKMKIWEYAKFILFGLGSLAYKTKEDARSRHSNHMQNAWSWSGENVRVSACRNISARLTAPHLATYQ